MCVIVERDWPVTGLPPGEESMCVIVERDWPVTGCGLPPGEESLCVIVESDWPVTGLPPGENQNFIPTPNPTKDHK